MPVIRVDGPKVADVDKKRRFVKDVTDAASTLYGLSTQAIVVLLQENSPDNVGVGGQLVIDRRKPDGAGS
ncbi:MAG: 4-oxalocrotonate tautomerase family protein [Kiritimatiellae bacterium]|nr:4-oxalocrotonate tautomerase family protein [Kiritimatiellia bacterium]